MNQNTRENREQSKMKVKIKKIIAKSQIPTQSRRNTTCNTNGKREEGEIPQVHIVVASVMFDAGKVISVLGSKDERLI